MGIFAETFDGRYIGSRKVDLNPYACLFNLKDCQNKTTKHARLQNYQGNCGNVLFIAQNMQNKILKRRICFMWLVVAKKTYCRLANIFFMDDSDTMKSTGSGFVCFGFNVVLKVFHLYDGGVLISRCYLPK